MLTATHPPTLRLCIISSDFGLTVAVSAPEDIVGGRTKNLSNKLKK